MKFNINDHVWIRLTDRGRKVYAEHDREPLKEIDGQVRFQLWEVMHIFGSSIEMGFDTPFETTIGVGEMLPSKREELQGELIAAKAREEKLMHELIRETAEVRRLSKALEEGGE